MKKTNLWTIRPKINSYAPQFTFPGHHWSEQRLLSATGDSNTPDSAEGERSSEQLRQRRSEIISQLAEGGLSPEQQTTLRAELRRIEDQLALENNRYLTEFKNLDEAGLAQKLDQINDKISPYLLKDPTEEAQIAELADLRLQLAAINKLQSKAPDTDIDQAVEDTAKLNAGQTLTSPESLQRQVETIDQMIEKDGPRRDKAYVEWRDKIEEIKGIELNINNLKEVLRDPHTIIKNHEVRQKVYQSVIEPYEGINKKLGLTKEESDWFQTGEGTAPLNGKINEIIKVALEKAEEQRQEVYSNLFESMEANFQQRLKRLEDQWTNPELNSALNNNKKLMLEKINAAKNVIQRLHTLRSLKPGTPAYESAIKQMIADPERKAVIEKEIELLEQRKKRYEKAITANQVQNKKNFEEFEKTEQQMAAIKQQNQGLEPVAGHSLYDQYQALKAKHQRLDSELSSTEKQRKLESAIKALDKRIGDLNSNKITLSNEGHLNMASLIHSELRDMEHQTMDDIKSVDGEPNLEEPPDWEELRESFKAIIEKKERLLDRGAPEEITPFQIALQNIEQIKNDGLIGKIRSLLDQRTDLDDNPEQKDAALEQLSNLESTVMNLPNIKKRFETIHDVEGLKNFIRSGKTPGEDDLRELHDSYNKLKKDVSETENLVETYKHGYQTVLAYKNNLEKHIASGQGSTQSSSVRWLTPYDIKQMWDTFFEWSKRRYKRNSAERTGEVGSVLFKKIPLCDTLAHEFALQKDQEEIAEVNKLKENFEKRDAWALWDTMDDVVEKDHLRALITALAEKGRLDLDKPSLWRALSRVSGGAVTFNYQNPNAETNDLVVLDEKLNRAFVRIWGDNSLYREMKHKHKSAYKSEMENYKEDAKILGQSETNIGPACSRMLREWITAKQAGLPPPDGFEPHRYEAYVRYATEAGKMAPEAKFYYVIQGIRWGILARDRLGEFSGDYTANYPVMEFFDRDPKITMAEIEEWCKIEGPDLHNPKNSKFAPGVEFKAWFHTFLLPQQMIDERVNQRFDKGEFLDHDDTSAFITIAKASSIQKLLRWRGSSGGFEASGRQNISAAMLFGMQCRALRMNKDPEHAPEDFTDFLSAWLRFYSISTSLIYKKSDDYVKLSEEMLDKPPRVAGAYVTTLGSTREYLNTMRGYMVQIDPQLFSVVFDRKIQFKDRIAAIKKTLNENPKYAKPGQDVWQSIRGERSEPENDEQLHENFMGDIIKLAVRSNSEPGGTVDQMIHSVQNLVEKSSPEGFKAILDPPPLPARKGDRRVLVPPL